MSTYIGYLGNLLNRLFGVPFGAGQFVSGCMFLVYFGGGTGKKARRVPAAGLLKGIIELLTGSTHGVAIILVSLTQGLLVGCCAPDYEAAQFAELCTCRGSCGCVQCVCFSAPYFSHAPIAYILFIGLLAFVSGVLLAGSLGHSVLR